MNLSLKEIKKISRQRIYNYPGVSTFERSPYKGLDSPKKLKFIRIGFLILLFVAFAMYGADCGFDYQDIFGQLEFFAFYFTIASFIVILINESRSEISPTARKIQLKVFEVAVSINMACFLMFFIFNPIIFGNGYMKKLNFLNCASIFLSFACTIAQLVMCDVIMVE